MSKDTARKRSPLRHRRLREAGQSLQEQIDRQYQKALSYIILSGVCVALAVAAWLSVIVESPRSPWIPTALALLVICYSAVRVWRIEHKLRNLELGWNGEKQVAEELDGLKQEGAIILHDVVAEGENGKRFNLDHVVCCRKGVFVIETKTRSKRSEGKKNEIVYDGSRVLVNGIEDRDVIPQATRNANWLQKTLFDSTGKMFAVRPVIVFPGWWVEGAPKGAAVWVLNPKEQLAGFIRNEPVSISDEDLDHIVRQLSNYVLNH